MRKTEIQRKDGFGRNFITFLFFFSKLYVAYHHSVSWQILEKITFLFLCTVFGVRLGHSFYFSSYFRFTKGWNTVHFGGCWHLGFLDKILVAKNLTIIFAEKSSILKQSFCRRNRKQLDFFLKPTQHRGKNN